MTFIIDDKIPYIKGVLEPFGEVLYLPGASITPSVVKNATALIIRTRTRCDATLLEGSSVSYIVTATIGYDHIDTAYCQAAGIQWMNAPGCNADSVVQYVASALLTLSQRNDFLLKGKTMGVVGVGQVGSKVALMAESLGMRVLLNDPIRSRNEGSAAFCSLDTLLQEADIISLHVPLTYIGEEATFHLVDDAFLQRVARNPILFNTCRGEVIHAASVIEARRQAVLSGLVIDCWEGEPYIDQGLLDVADIGTPHIAGYSRDGKANATTMAVQAVSQALHLGMDNWQVAPYEQPENPSIRVDATCLSDEAVIASVVQRTYDILKDDQALRLNPAQFEQLRENYPIRREFPAYTLKLAGVSKQAHRQLQQLGFVVN